MAIVLGVLEQAKANDYERFVTVLVSYAESDLDPAAVQHGRTFGVFQQTDAVNKQGVPFWPTAHGTTAEQAAAFLAAFRGANHTGDPVTDAWIVQRWAVPNEGATWPDPGPGFLTAPETVNYSRRLPDIPRLLTGKL